MPVSKKVIFIVGPTGAGKTGISIKLAKKINAEIVCCDSMQIYKNLDIMTGQPASRQMSLAAHHLFGIKNPTEDFSVAEYRKLALKKIKEIQQKGRDVIFVGGTGLYVQVLLDGLFLSPKKDLKFRKRLYAQAEKYGIEKLFEKLKNIDAVAARLIHPNDLRRIVRALEVYKLTGKTISELKTQSSGGIFGLYPTYIFCLFYKDRNLLYDRINRRVDDMFKKGLVKEVQSLSRFKFGMTASQALGLKQVQSFIKGEYDLEKAKELLKLDTRRYAKRQMSWFRRDKRIKWIPLDCYNNISSVVSELKNMIENP